MPAAATSESIEGWSNWDTWETVLIMDNDERLYQTMESLAREFWERKLAGRFSLRSASRAVMTEVVPAARAEERRLAAGTDSDRIDWTKVNAEEIAKVLLDRGREAAEYAAARRE